MNPRAHATNPIEPSAARGHGFTLIELLVVITIIVILLALLAPALDRAVYQAELVVCAAQQRGVAASVQAYCIAYQRRYPDRPPVRGGSPQKVLSTSGYDARQLLKPYLSINDSLLCVLLPAKVDYEGSAADTTVEASFNLFFGSQLRDDQSGSLAQGMLKLGDRWVWKGVGYGVLTNDYDEIAPNSNVAYSTHPDYDHVGTPDIYQDTPSLIFGNFTVSRWAYFTGTHKRPPIDTQHAMDDGSVGRITRVTWDEGESTGAGRMDKVPSYTSANGWIDGDGAGQWTYVPRN